MCQRFGWRLTVGRVMYQSLKALSYFCKMPKRILVIFFIALISCSHDPYKASNKEYKKETKDLSNTIRQEPADYFTSQNTGWVGAVNFDLRKPNFVIIHH